MKKRMIAVMLCAVMCFSGCGGKNVETTTVETQSEATTAQSQTLETYSDDYVSFEYDKDLFNIQRTDDGMAIAVKCPSMPDEPVGTHNTILTIVTQYNDSISDFSQTDAQTLCETAAKGLCQRYFELNDNESIINEKSSFSNFCAEYYMEVSDGSKCYCKVLNYNSYMTMVCLRLCEYSKDYNDAFIAVYNSAESILGNIDFDSIVTDSQSSSDASNQQETTTPNTSSATTGQKNALSQALSYLSFSAFSHSSLIGQLKYEGYSDDEATYAADNCGADWNAQALKQAKSYLEFSSFSYSGLIEQLEYEGFSNDEATYAVDNCGADWNEQAAKKAQSYLDTMSFSRSGLIDQLEYEGFTAEQAEYGVSAVGY